MKLLAVLAGFLCMAASQEIENSDLDPPLEASSRIAEGVLAKPGQFPYQGYVITSVHPCAAVLIKQRWALTSAVCVSGSYKKRVFFGSTSDHLFPVEREITKVVIHPEFNSSLLHHNIALIKFEAVPLGAIIKPIEIGVLGNITGRFVTVIGYGLNSSSIGPHHLKYASLKVISKDECKKFYKPDYIIDSTLCAGSISGRGEGVQFGDSGGPLVMGYENPLLVGIVSFANPKGYDKHTPSGFVRVDRYKDWIDKTTLVDTEG